MTQNPARTKSREIMNSSHTQGPNAQIQMFQGGLRAEGTKVTGTKAGQGKHSSATQRREPTLYPMDTIHPGAASPPVVLKREIVNHSTAG